MISGYAVRYGTPYQRGGPDRPTKWTEIIERGACDRAIRDRHVVFDVCHDGVPLASTRNGSLWCVSDQEGLWYCATLDRSWSEFGIDVDAIERRVATGQLNRASWAGNPAVARWEDFHGDDANPYHAPVYRIIELDLMAVSVTNRPACMATSAKSTPDRKASVKPAAAGRGLPRHVDTAPMHPRAAAIRGRAAQLARSHDAGLGVERR